MKYSNYKDSVRHMASLESFRSNSMFGQMGNATYIVFSYSTAIAYIARDCSRAFVNVHKYSVTTSKHQTYVRQAIKELRYKHPEMEIVEFDAFLAEAVNA
jgi:hypothetical protein